MNTIQEKAKSITLPLITPKQVDETNVEWILNNGEAVLYLMRNRDKIQELIAQAVVLSNVVLMKQSLDKI